MATPPNARSREQRIRDVELRLDQDIDAWVATGDPATGEPFLAPFSFLWDGSTLLFATAATARSTRNLQANPVARVALGGTRDVVLLVGSFEVLALDAIPTEVGDAFAAKTGFDPRAVNGAYTYCRFRPERVQAWREENELADRHLMRAGAWLTD